MDIDNTISFLNSLVDLDRHGIQELFSLRVGCNQALADHRSVQVSADPKWIAPGQYRVGLLGVLNGLLGADDAGNGYLAANYNNDGVLTGFVRFGRTSE